MIARAAFRSALRATKAPASPLAQIGARRGYAEAVSDKLKLSFILPHEVRISIQYSLATKSQQMQHRNQWQQCATTIQHESMKEKMH